MRGKYAVRSENNKVSELTAEVNRLRVQLKAEAESHRIRERGLTDELARLKADILVEASRLAEHKFDELEKVRHIQGVSIQFVRMVMHRLDRLCLNACRYLSMTEGIHPTYAAEQVMTWVTDEDFKMTVDPDGMLFSLGFHADSWMAKILSYGDKHQRARWKSKGVMEKFHSLDYVDQNLKEFGEKIHPSYDPKWYQGGGAPKSVAGIRRAKDGPRTKR